MINISIRFVVSLLHEGLPVVSTEPPIQKPVTDGSKFSRFCPSFGTATEVFMSVDADYIKTKAGDVTSYQCISP